MLFLQQQGGDMFTTMLFMGLIIAVAYFFLIRPQNQLRDKQKKFSESVKKGDKVVTMGGLHGVVLEITDATITLLIDKDSKTKAVYQKESISFDMTKAAYPNTEV